MLWVARRVMRLLQSGRVRRLNRITARNVVERKDRVEMVVRLPDLDANHLTRCAIDHPHAKRRCFHWVWDDLQMHHCGGDTLTLPGSTRQLKRAARDDHGGRTTPKFNTVTFQIPPC
ncbi:hypothetical protein FOQG_04616 [Fusarium oxysporum f. sp. raphani 54005]|uniref:Uncharacterized protein n=2 Tax=Fusarium oxysporum TaxID=5507 RepID=X0CUP1_FUSOX|nr:hypothetical protein FOQG_04616 [Fusarium oxysporum f. sp. raphani 54005]EXK94600.1 hypothetical protein FOQG_04616 [Fusarium oxysporum f. sp. raphani 54005]EXL77502.1 hypothetical protein FOPG_08058 [Fusarium oxysporum f. sp. conglutinans race 2 54008]EXL77503.1 hypothetical protein FOPG_08058 [Fusarium oxysporum f. sp. conglutinans race 2 54008]KAI8413622.1 hypothetical protein FOFC_06903 [Fusarium oxysporum]